DRQPATVRHLLRHHWRTGLRLVRRGRQLVADRVAPAGRVVGRGSVAGVIKVELPESLRTLAKVSGELSFEVRGAVTVRSVLDAVEARYPMLRGTIRDHDTLERRGYLRFFACGRDLSHDA